MAGKEYTVLYKLTGDTSNITTALENARKNAEDVQKQMSKLTLGKTSKNGINQLETQIKQLDNMFQRIGENATKLSVFTNYETGLKNMVTQTNQAVRQINEAFAGIGANANILNLLAGKGTGVASTEQNRTLKEQTKNLRQNAEARNALARSIWQQRKSLASGYANFGNIERDLKKAQIDLRQTDQQVVQAQKWGVTTAAEKAKFAKLLEKQGDLKAQISELQNTKNLLQQLRELQSQRGPTLQAVKGGAAQSPVNAGAVATANASLEQSIALISKIAELSEKTQTIKIGSVTREAETAWQGMLAKYDEIKSSIENNPIKIQSVAAPGTPLAAKKEEERKGKKRGRPAKETVPVNTKLEKLKDDLKTQITTLRNIAKEMPVMVPLRFQSELGTGLNLTLTEIQNLANSKAVSMPVKMKPITQAEISRLRTEAQKVVAEKPVSFAATLKTISAAEINKVIADIKAKVEKKSVSIPVKFRPPVANEITQAVRAWQAKLDKKPLYVKVALSRKAGENPVEKLINNKLKPIELQVNITTAKQQIDELVAYARSKSPLNLTATVTGKNKGATPTSTTSPSATVKDSNLFGRTRAALYPLTGNTSFGARTPMAVDMLKGMGMMYGITGLMSAVGGAFRSSTEFESSMKTVAAILRTSDKGKGFEGRFDAMEQEIRRIGKETKFTAPEVAGAAKFMAMAGLNMENIRNATAPIANVALVGDNDLAETADKMTNIMTAFGLLKDRTPGQQSASMNHTADVLVNTFTKSNTSLMQLAEAMQYAGPMSHLSGTSVEDASAMIGVMGNAGIQASMAGTTLRMMYNNILKPNKKQLAEWDALGVQRTDSNGRIRPIFDILKDLRAAIVGTDDLSVKVGAEQLKDLGSKTMSMFRVTAGAGAATLLENLDQVIALSESNRTASGVAGQIADEKKNTISGLWAQVVSAFTDTNLNKFKDFQTVIKDVLISLRDWMGSEEAARTMGDIVDLFKTGMEILVQVSKILHGIYSLAPGLFKFWMKAQMFLTMAGKVLVPFTLLTRVFDMLRNTVMKLNVAMGVSSATGAAGVVGGGSAVARAATTAAVTAPWAMTGPKIYNGKYTDNIKRAHMLNWMPVNNAERIAMSSMGQKQWIAYLAANSVIGGIPMRQAYGARAAQLDSRINTIKQRLVWGSQNIKGFENTREYRNLKEGLARYRAQHGEMVLAEGRYNQFRTSPISYTTAPYQVTNYNPLMGGKVPAAYAGIYAARAGQYEAAAAKYSALGLTATADRYNQKATTYRAAIAASQKRITDARTARLATRSASASAWARLGAMGKGGVTAAFYSGMMGVGNPFAGLLNTLKSLGLGLVKVFGMMLNPISLVTAGVAALGYGIYRAVDHFKTLSKQTKVLADTQKHIAYDMNQKLIDTRLNAAVAAGALVAEDSGYNKAVEGVEMGRKYSLVDNKYYRDLINDDLGVVRASRIFNTYVRGAGDTAKYLPDDLLSTWAALNPDLVASEKIDRKTGDYVTTYSNNEAAVESARKWGVITQWISQALSTPEMVQAATAIEKAAASGDYTTINKVLSAYNSYEGLSKMSSMSWKDLKDIQELDVTQYYELAAAQFKYLKQLADDQALPLRSQQKMHELIAQFKTGGIKDASKISADDRNTFIQTALQSVKNSYEGKGFQIMFDKMGNVDWQGLANTVHDGVPFTLNQQLDILANTYKTLLDDPKIGDIAGILEMLQQYLPTIANNRPVLVGGMMASGNDVLKQMDDFNEGVVSVETIQKLQGRIAHRNNAAKEIDPLTGLPKTLLPGSAIPSQYETFIKQIGGEQALNQLTPEQAYFKWLLSPKNTTAGSGSNGGGGVNNQDAYNSHYQRNTARPTQIVFNMDSLCKFDHSSFNTADQRDLAQNIESQVSQAVLLAMSQAYGSAGAMAENNGFNASGNIDSMSA